MPGPRFQGTDGVRGLAVADDHPRARGLDPRRAFLDRGLLTPAFVGHYAFAAAGWLLEGAGEELISQGAVVFAWDPRDSEGCLTDAALGGILRAGAHTLALGVFPTPAAAVYLAACGAAGALVLTASHNLADQNGLKLLCAPHARKPLPEEDEAISARVWAGRWETVRDLPESGRCIEAGAEARAVYMDHIARLSNCWLRGGDLAGWDIVLDPAGGAWSGLAADAVGGLGPGRLEEVNPLGAGPVNEGGGVIALEGRRAVAGGEEELIRSHAGLAALFAAGRARAEALRAGEGFAAAGVFDADGDRAYTLVYDPFEDAVRVLGGDEALVLQARFLRAEGELPEGGTAVLTIESDAGAAAALVELGLRVAFAPVGDKWVLRAAERWGEAFALGGEESGHTVVPGLLVDAAGRASRLAVGDGLKSFLNTCAAIAALAEGADPGATYRALASPFPRGYKKSFYAYHVDRGRFAPGSAAWEAIRRALWEAVRAELPGGAVPRWAPVEDDPGVLCLTLEDAGARPRACLYVRNSGTESRTGVVVRGPAEWEGPLRAAGEAVLREVLLRMKDEESPLARAEEALLAALGEGAAGDAALARASLPGEQVSPERVREEARRGELVHEEGGRLELTGLGRWYLERRR